MLLKGILPAGLRSAMAVAIMLGATAGALAQSSGDDTERSARIAKLLETADADGDGRITQAELKFMIVRIFDLLDEDASNFIDPGEISGVGPESFGKADLDGDGKLSALEFLGSDFVVFQNMDRDRNGSVTREELTDYLDGLK